MKNRLKIIDELIVILLLIVFTACNGQNVSIDSKQVFNNSQNTLFFGDTVSEMKSGIMVIFQDSKNNYWFGSKRNGIYKYDGKSLVQFTKKDGLCSNSNGARNIQEDKDGNIYFDTGEGISKFDGKSFETLKVIRNSVMVQNEWKLEEDDLWFAGNWNENGPYRYDGESLYHLEFSEHPKYEAFLESYPNQDLSPFDIYTIYKDNKGHIWFGTVVFGVCRYDGKSLSWIFEDELGELEDGRVPAVRSIIEDKNGHFWFSNILSRYEISQAYSVSLGEIKYEKLLGIDIEKEKNKVKFPYFMSIVDDKNGDLWMATYDQGVWKYDGKELTHYPIKKNNKTVELFSIYRDHEDDLWLGTHNEGVYKFNDSTFEPFIPAVKK